MTTRRAVLPLICALAAAGELAPADACAAPVLRSADIHVTIGSPDTCAVTMTLVVEGGDVIDHRIELAAGTRVELTGIRGAEQQGEPQTIGRTRSLLLQSGSTEYALSYQVQRASGGVRCPLWLPAAPADGISRAVRIRVELPPGVTARSTLPAFTWNGPEGTTTLGHIPAFVRVPFASSGEATAWDVATVMDVVAVAVFAAATAVWIVRRRR